MIAIISIEAIVAILAVFAIAPLAAPTRRRVVEYGQKIVNYFKILQNILENHKIS